MSTDIRGHEASTHHHRQRQYRYESDVSFQRFWTRVDGLDAAYIFLRGAHFVRMIRFFEHMGSNSSIHAMWIAIINCKSELLLLLGVFAILAVFFGTLVYFCELFRLKFLAVFHVCASVSRSQHPSGSTFDRSSQIIHK